MEDAHSSAQDAHPAIPWFGLLARTLGATSLSPPMSAAQSRNIPVANLLSALKERAVTLGILFLLAFALSVPFLLTAIRAALRYDVARVPDSAGIPAAQLVDLPDFGETADPVAILVLDVSGSMKDTDPSFEQLRAVRTFLTIFQHMAAGAGAEDSKPYVGVVLYGEVARVCSDENRLWAPMESQARAWDLADRLGLLLGSRETRTPDPRRGLNTDHLAAARLTGEIITRYRAEMGAERPACVVFMTDGQHDPSPLTDAGLSPERRASNRDLFWKRLLETAHARGPAVKSRLNALRTEFEAQWAGQGTAAVLFQDSGIAQRVFPLFHLRVAVNELLQPGAYESSLAGLPTAAEPTAQAIRSSLGLANRDAFRFIRLGVSPGGHEGAGASAEALDVSRAEDLTGAFVGVLAQWLHLINCPVSGDFRVRVPIGVHSLAVVVEPGGSGAAGTLRSLHASAPISSGLALLANPAPGDWVVDMGGNSILGVEAWADPRFRWAFGGVPVSYSILDSAPGGFVGLYSLADKRLVSPDTLYQRPPETASLVVSCQGRPVSEQTLAWSARDNRFLFKLAQPPDGRPGPVLLDAEIDGLTLKDGTQCEPENVHGETRFGEAIRAQLEQAVSDQTRKPIGGIHGLEVGRGSCIGER